MTIKTKAEATIADLYAIKGKAEIIDGELVQMAPTGFLPGRAGYRICKSLEGAERQAGGWAVPDNVGFVVNLPRRKSFSPDAAFFKGSPTGMKFLNGAPVFAAEIRSENDYSPKAEKAILRKIADYFAAGTLVVWDVNLLSPDVIRFYQVSDPANPIIFRRGDVAHAEPAVPGWRMAVDDLFK